MNDNTSFERHVIEAFDREGKGRPVPDAIHDELLSHAGQTRQWPTWLASIKEPPMRLSNSVAVGSPTVRVAAVMAATLLLALALAAAGIAGQRLFAATADYVVDADGAGDFITITEAVAVAQDGESVLVKNGTYAESVTITEDITLIGESRDGVILEFGAGCTEEGLGLDFEQTCPPEVPQLDGTEFMPPGPYGLHLDGTEASVSDLTFRHLSGGYGLYASGGVPTISNVAYANNTYENPDGLNMVMLRGGTAATITESDFGQGWVDVEERSPVTLETTTAGSFLADTPLSEVSGGPAIFRGNITDGMFWINGMAVVEGNTISVNPEGTEPAIYIERGDGWIVRDNIVHGATSDRGAIAVEQFAGPGQVLNNTVAGSKIGIVVSNDSLVEGNTITDGTTGIRVSMGSPQLLRNTIVGMSGIGVNIGLAEPLLGGNDACGNATDLLITQGSDAIVDDTNEFCVVNDMREG